MDIVNKLKEIENYFDNLTVEEFELKLERAGMGQINPSGMEMVLDTRLDLLMPLYNAYSSGLIIEPNNNIFPNDFEVAA